MRKSLYKPCAVHVQDKGETVKTKRQKRKFINQAIIACVAIAPIVLLTTIAAASGI